MLALPALALACHVGPAADDAAAPGADDTAAHTDGGGETDGGGADAGDGGSPPAPEAPEALLALEPPGILVRAAVEGATLELAGDDGAWSAVEGALPAGAWTWIEAEASAVRVVHEGLPSTAVAPAAATAALAIPLPGGPLVATDLLEPALATSLSGPARLVLPVVLHEAVGERQAWLDPDCPPQADLDACLLDAPAEAALPAVEAAALPAVRPVHAAPAQLALSATVSLDAVDLAGAPLLVEVAAAALDPLPSLGRALSWGDLHGHSNLSYDGCEDEADACAPRGAWGAEDFYAEATAAGLDFAALTDHAEWGEYRPAGEHGAGCDIWAEQQARVVAADAVEGGPVPLLGYEWSNARGRPVDDSAPYEGGHKTVVFQEPTVHPDFRVGAVKREEATWKGEGYYRIADGPTATSPEALREALAAAAAKHGATPVLTFFHHPAMEAPQAVDFGNPINAPDPATETLVEVYSEHGSSECIDPTQADCDWQINDLGYAYLERGSVQYALSMGYRLGFTAGTDSHDARPGSWQDGPGYHGASGEPLMEPHVQFAPGGLTGVWVAGALDRERLFAGLMQRATVATSGPRPLVRALAIDADGAPWLPGAEVGAGPLRLLVALEADEGSVLRLQLVDASGAVRHEVEGAAADWTVEGEGAWYVRAILLDGEGEEHRAWISPWFAGG